MLQTVAQIRHIAWNSTNIRPLGSATSRWCLNTEFVTKRV